MLESRAPDQMLSKSFDTEARLEVLDGIALPHFAAIGGQHMAFEGTEQADRGGLALRRARDSDLTKADILAVATKEFAARGLSGARVDAIAKQTRTSKRMIYYYFESKEGLYLAVLENAYQKIRDIETSLSLDNLDPITAISRLVDATFDYDESHPEFIRLVSIENVHFGQHMHKIESMNKLNAGAITAVTRIIERGQESGLFRNDIDPIDIHMMISAMCVFRIANRHTFEFIFNVDFSEPKRRARQKSMIREAVIEILSRK